jgi:hypothetical protein
MMLAVERDSSAAGRPFTGRLLAGADDDADQADGGEQDGGDERRAEAARRRLPQGHERAIARRLKDIVVEVGWYGP